MDLGKKIFELRKLNNITQEQLAKAVGVSTPAVCKWETGVSLPDITLLAPIARKLNTDLDNLLSFREALTKTEVEEIMKVIKDTARRNGLSAGMDKCHEYLRQYPNVDELKLKIAMVPMVFAYTAEEEYFRDEAKYQSLMEESTVLLEELMHSNDDLIRMSANLYILNRYMEQQRFDEAEAILQKFKNQSFEVRHFYPSLYLMKGEYDKVMECSQANMIRDKDHLLGDIRSQHTVYLKNKDYDKALKCAKDYLSLIKLAGTNEMCGYELMVDTYLAMDNIDCAVKYFLKYIEDIMNVSGDYRGTFYYSHIADKIATTSTEVGHDVKKVFYQCILHDDRYSCLRELEEVTVKLEQLKNCIQLV